jgi:hypothetical protein
MDDKKENFTFMVNLEYFFTTFVRPLRLMWSVIKELLSQSNRIFGQYCSVLNRTNSDFCYIKESRIFIIYRV